jgi:hypothetical protein
MFNAPPLQRPLEMTSKTPASGTAHAMRPARVLPHRTIGARGRFAAQQDGLG